MFLASNAALLTATVGGKALAGGENEHVSFPPNQLGSNKEAPQQGNGTQCSPHKT